MRYMSAGAVARELGLSRMSVWRLTRAGVLPVGAVVEQQSGSRVETVFSTADVEALKRARANQARERRAA